ncbi:TetR/AcrR family transcriptional regulator [Nocardia sp. NPDC127526]|uniref:TetR/AcrR family transcriptional regulator n=1 Tax=Nocardia sp. NPDC127526 TaxID=3345393 RepID=UPI003627B614
MAQSDGRRARGKQRYELLMTAAIRVIRTGIPSVTIRAVAEAAGVSIASVTYHFPTRTHLIRELCGEVAKRDAIATSRAFDELRAQSDLATISPVHLSKWLLNLLYDPDQWILTMFSTYLEIAREPELAPICRKWEQSLVDILATALAEAGAPAPDRAARLLAATLDGMRLPLLAEPRTTPRQIEIDDLAALLGWLLNRSP